MNVILIILALGGYSSSSPALLKLEAANMQQCEAVAQKLIADLRAQRGLGTLYRSGAEHITYSCVEVAK